MITDTQRYKTSRANWEIADPGASGAISVRQSGYVPIVTAAAESRTVDDPYKPGLDLTLEMKTDGGDCTITFDTAFTEAGDTTLVLSDPGQFASFKSIESGTSYVWRRYAADPTEAATLTTVNATSANVTNLTIGAASSTTITGDSGAYSQASSITTAVAVTTDAGIITTQAASANAGVSTVFGITKTGFLKNDLVQVSCAYNGTTGTPSVNVSDQANGTHTIVINNSHASEALNGTLEISYWVIHINAA